MKDFIIKGSIFMIAILVSMIVLFYQANGYTDSFYTKLSTPEKSSLIIGSSRAAQGIIPEMLNRDTQNQFFNFSFSMSHSPYGNTYLRAIKRKLNDTTKSSKFIVCVNPWTLSSIASVSDDTSQFRELNYSLAKTKKVSIHPNFQYLIDSYTGKYFELIPIYTSLKKRLFPYYTFAHEDGYLEVFINKDSSDIELKTTHKLNDYRNKFLSNYKFSEARINSLKETLEYLNNRGSVLMVRLPVHHKMLEIENEFMPNFNGRMSDLSSEFNLAYLDMTNSNQKYFYTDGNHLTKASAIIVTQKISDIIGP